jgi:tRNA pseudouridine38-40 synthase
VERTTYTWRFVVAYHGARFVGWQKQEGERSVQGELERALTAISGGEQIHARAAGRTDAGVHARAQLVSARFSCRVPPEKMLLALGSQLPEDLAVVQAERVGEQFDARRHSVGKRYVYRVHMAQHGDPFGGSLSWHVRQKLDVDKMKLAAQHFVGELDFESFRSQHCDAAHARRYVWRSQIHVDGPTLAYEVRGNAFCRHQVRCMAGTLVDVGRGRFTPDDIPRILDARDRTKAGVTAPAEGLMLEEVYCPDRMEHAELPADARFPGWPPDDEAIAVCRVLST